MRKLLAFLLLSAGTLMAQVSAPSVRYVVTPPSGACAQSPPIQIVISTGIIWGCVSGTWESIGGGGSGGISSVTGTANQIDVANGTTTPVVSLDPNFRGTSYTVGTGGVTANTVVSADTSGNVVTSGGNAYVGIATATVTAGNPVIVANASGQLQACQFDGTPVIGHTVGVSATPGECHDTGTVTNSISPRATIVGWVESVSGTVGTVRLAGLGLWGSANLLVNNTLSNQTLFGPLTLPQVTSAEFSNRFYSDGFTTGNNYSGIGQAQIPWVAGNYGQCTAVSYNAASITAWSITSNIATFTSTNSYAVGQFVTLSAFGTSTFFNGVSAQIISTGLSGSQFEVAFTHANGSATESGSATLNYLSVVHLTSATPGGSSAVWYPVPNGNTPTGGDCAFYTSAGSIATGTGTVTNRVGADLWFPPSETDFCIGMVEPTVSSATDPVVNLRGAGQFITILKQTCAISNPMIEQPETLSAFQFATFTWDGFTANANFNAPAVMGVYGAVNEVMTNLVVNNATDGSDHYIEMGDFNNTADGWTYQMNMDNIYIGRNASGWGSGASITATVSGGVPSFTIVSGGHNYTQGLITAELYGNSAGGRACSSLGTTTATVTGTAITAITSSATGCVAPLYVWIQPGNINYGIKMSNVSDSQNISAITDGGVGTIAGMYLATNSANITVTKFHPESTQRGVWNGGANTFISLQCDSTVQYCFDHEAGGGITTIVAPSFEWNTSTLYGSADFYFNIASGTPGVNVPALFTIYGEQCANPAPSGYAKYITSAGVVDSNVGSDSAVLPLYVHDYGPIYCNQETQPATTGAPTNVSSHITWSNGAIGNSWDFALTPGFLSGGCCQSVTVTNPATVGTSALGEFIWDWTNPTPSTSSNNYASPTVGAFGTYWNGSASAAFGVNQQLIFGSGSNPTSAYAFTHSGTLPGSLVYTWDEPLTITNGSTATTQTAGDNSTKVATTAYVATAIGTVIANTTFTNATTALTANTCSASAVTVTMTGVTTASTFIITPSADVSGSNGWGTAGGLVIDAWPTSNTLNYKLCNQSSGSITPGAVTWNVAAK